MERHHILVEQKYEKKIYMKARTAVPTVKIKMTSVRLNMI